MLLISFQCVFQFVSFLQRIAYRIQTTISGSLCNDGFSTECRSNPCYDAVFLLLEMNLIDAVWFNHIFEGRFEQTEDLVRMKLFVLVIGHCFGCIAHSLAHFRRKVQAKLCLQYIAYTALSGLAVDTDNICVVVSSHICRIDRQIRNSPVLQISVLSPVHTLCDGILMRSGKCSKYKSSTVRTSFIDLHSGTFLINLANMRHIRKINLRVHTLGIHIHTKRYNIHITGTLTISEQSSLNSVSTCKKTHLGVCNATSTIIVRMKRNDHVFTVFQIITHVFHLTCIHMRHRMLNRNRQVDDRFVICSGLPYIQNRIAHLQCILRLCSRKALRAVLKLKIAFCLISQFFQKCSAIYCDLQDLLF